MREILVEIGLGVPELARIVKTREDDLEAYIDLYDKGETGTLPDGIRYLFDFITNDSEHDRRKVDDYLLSNFSELYE